MVDLIIKKRNGEALSEEEISFFIDGYVAGNIPDYQASALAMAIFFKGMNSKELSSLTKKMMHSGDVIDLSDIGGIKVDKHSTGGVGDKPSIIIAPLVASVGIPVPMIAGRALGHTGGTLDKLGSIPNFNVNLTINEYKNQIKTIGTAICGQTSNFVPADKKLYALRDVTGTVESIPLISASIMSKKLAEGADCFVFDVKTGNGAFMTSLEHSTDLAQHLVDIGKEMGKKVVAVITDMNQPLGTHIGNSLEIIECINCLKGLCGFDTDLMKLTLLLSAHMLVLGGKANDIESANEILIDKIKSGEALRKFAEMISAQNGNPKVIDDLSLIPVAKNLYEIKSREDGYIAGFETRTIGTGLMMLGAGRRKYDDEIDHEVGMIVKKKIGDTVKSNETIFEIYYNDEEKLKDAIELLETSFKIDKTPPTIPQLIYKII